MKKFIGLFVSFAATTVFANEAAPVVVASTGVSNFAWFAIAIGIMMGLAILGGALGQGRAAAAALEGIARNPGASGKIFVPMILGMALIESLVLFGLLIAFMLFGKIA
ncbi:MAG: ATP synthase F0 subunit C [Myxococcota bacterium]